MTPFCQKPYPRPFTFYAAVLAGGRSLRMQTDKRFLKIQGELLIDRALRLAQDSVRAYGGEVFLCGDVPGRKALPDAVSGLGPLSGIRSALDVISPDYNTWLLVLPVDMPLLNETSLKNLFAEVITENEKVHQAICFDGFEMPCLIHISPNVKRAVEDLCQEARPSSTRSIRALFKQIGVRRLELSTSLKSMMVNANLPSDWARICEAEVSR
jgi:molybdopterin-guanine dinucleotide biosynthesis protein A